MYTKGALDDIYSCWNKTVFVSQATVDKEEPNPRAGQRDE